MPFRHCQRLPLRYAYVYFAADYFDTLMLRVRNE